MFPHAFCLFQDGNAEECPVCLMAYDDNLGRPRNLPCGHTYCTRCVNGFTEQDRATCPTCRVVHAVPETGQFPVSYAVEALIRRMRNMASAVPPPDAGEPALSASGQPGKRKRAGLSKAIRSMLQSQEAKVLAAIRTCQDVQAQLDQYQTTLAGWGEQQQQLEERLLALVEQSRNSRMLVQQEESKVAAKKEQLQQRKQHLRALLPALRTPTTPHEAIDVIDNADHCIDEEIPKVEECQKLFPEVPAVTTIGQVSDPPFLVPTVSSDNCISCQPYCQSHSSVPASPTVPPTAVFLPAPLSLPQQCFHACRSVPSPAVAS